MSELRTISKIDAKFPHLLTVLANVFAVIIYVYELSQSLDDVYILLRPCYNHFRPFV